MAEGKSIVYLDVTTPEMRGMISEQLPPGFEIAFAESDGEDKSAAAIGDADYILTVAAQMPDRVVTAARKARLIQKIGEGTDRIDVATAAAMGIPVAKTAGNNSVSVAEGATMLILSTLRWLPSLHNSVVAGRFPKFDYRSRSYELRGKQVGIIGIGKIGRTVAEHMQGFRASVVYYDVARLPEAEEVRLGVRFLPLDDLLRTSDVVTLHVPLMPSTRGLIGAREIDLMKPTSILVNTCRGPVVDEDALHRALKERRILGAGIDAFSKEPPDPNNPLFALDNVVLTPHSAGGTVDSGIEGIRRAFANIVRVDRGEPLNPSDLAPIPR